jgi:hypothetical protein
MTMMVSHGNEVDIVLPHTINNVVRVTRNDSFTEFAGKRGACLRVDRNPFRCLLDG